MTPSSLLGSAVHALSAHMDVFTALLSTVDASQARWKPASERWSVLEVICHLADEERDDFRVRLRSTLETPDLNWTPIDPQGWVLERRYNERDLAGALEAFLSERHASLTWLRSLDAPDLATAHHERGRSMTAGDLLAAWVAHDLLHIRQLNQLHYDYWARQVAPHQVGYAGEW